MRNQLNTLFPSLHRRVVELRVGPEGQCLQQVDTSTEVDLLQLSVVELSVALASVAAGSPGRPSSELELVGQALAPASMELLSSAVLRLLVELLSSVAQVRCTTSTWTPSTCNRSSP